MRHRGPDDEGITLIDPEQKIHQDLFAEWSVRPGRAPDIPHRIGIAHRRFSLVDTTAAGHQPFWDPEGNVCVAFNGEIYNYVELRTELEREGFRFRTASDTEVLVMAYQAWGVECFQRFNGFWALSLYDGERRQVLLARDRIGKAPLYVTRDPRRLSWASEIKGLFALSGSSEYPVRDQAVVDFVKWQIRDLFHETFYDHIASFPSASYAWVEADGSYQPVKYWDMPSRRLSMGDISIPEARDRLRDLLGDAVRLRLRADVPVSVQLSGGVDSSSLLALAASRSASRIHAYTVSFPDRDANEEPFARSVAEHYRGRVDYSVIEPSAADILDHADDYVALMGEPFHSPNQFTNHRIWTTMARQGFRANLYGAGGDEVFAGYSSDYFLPYLRYLLRQGRSIRFLKEFFQFSEHRPGRLGLDHVHRAGKLLLPEAVRLLPWAPRLYRNLVKEVRPECDPFLMPSGVRAHVGPSRDLDGRMRDNMTDWLMNYWLRIDNQNSMGVPLELRLPFLDHRVVEFGCTVPVELLIRHGWMKWLLRSSMEDLLPHDVIWRKQKMGFPFPLKRWLGRFKDRILSMIQPLDCPYLDMKKLNAGYDELRERDPAYLWCLISLALWWKRCVQGDRLS